MDPSALDPVSDGCTGFQLLELIFPIHDCCVVHDLGGTDGMLLDCLAAATPHWALPIVLICLAIMATFRPIYHLIKQTFGKGAQDGNPEA